MTPKRILLILLLVMTTAATGWAEKILTLPEALAIALSRNPTIHDARHQTRAAQARLQQTQAAYYPQVDLAGGYTHQWVEAENNHIYDDSQYAASLSLSQLIYDFGQTPRLVAASRHQVHGSQAELQAQRLLLARDVKLSYWETLKKKGLVAVSRSTLDLRQRYLDQARAMYRQGLRPKIDITRQEVEVSRAQLTLTQTEYALQSARVAFESLLGGPPLEGPYALAEMQPVVPALDPLPDFIARAIAQRPDIQSLESQIMAAQAALSARRSDRWPSLSGSAVYRNSGEAFPLDESWSAGVSLRWALFSGYAKSGRIAESLAAVKSLEARRDSLHLAVVDAVTQAHLAVQEVRQAIQTARQAEIQATENLALAEGRYEAGISTVIELNDAQVLYAEAQNALVQVTFDLLKAWAYLAHAVALPLDSADQLSLSKIK